MTRDWDEARIAALVDGSIDDPAEAARLEALLRTDPAARAAAERIARSNRLVQAAFPLPDAGETPETLRALVRRPPPRPAPRPGRRVRRAAPAIAVAASVLVVLGLGLHLAGPQRGAPGPGAADPALAEALETLPSGTDGPAEVRPMLTFRDGAGRICREYERPAEGGGLRAGIACRGAAGNWRVEGTALLSPADGVRTGEYAPAGGADGAGLDPVLDRLEAGPPLPPDEEAALIASDWTGAPRNTP